jgi:hypothetical protein
VVVEHRLARLGQLGIGQARYCGHIKTRFQLMMACSLANFRWVWNQEARQEAHLHSKATDFAARVGLYACIWLIQSFLSHLAPVPRARAILRQQFHIIQRLAA